MTAALLLTYITLYDVSSTNYEDQKPSLLLKQFSNKMSDVADRASRRNLITKGFEWEPQDIQDMLDAHNTYRAQTAGGTAPALSGTQPTAANMNKLFWDPALEKVATDFATTCPGLRHNYNRKEDLKAAQSLTTFIYVSGSTVGENMYMSSINPPVMEKIWNNNNYGILGSIQGWADSATDYNYYDGSCSGVCGHYTQLVWAKTRYVGCGFSQCEGQSYPTFVVCNYWPPGNFNNEKPYIAGIPCSQCEQDRLLCDDGLCAGGMSSGFVASGNIDVDQCYDGTGRNQCNDTDTTEAPTEITTTKQHVSVTCDESLLGEYNGETIMYYVEIPYLSEVSIVGLIITPSGLGKLRIRNSNGNILSPDSEEHILDSGVFSKSLQAGTYTLELIVLDNIYTTFFLEVVCDA